MDEKLFELMAQAEDLQKHAAKLQNEAQEAFLALPLAVEQAGQKIRSTGLQMALIMLGLGVIVCGVSAAFIGWSTDSLREERAVLQAENADLKALIQAEQSTFDGLRSKTWGLELITFRGGSRGVILPTGQQFERIATMQDGRSVAILR